jgi:hypothetical protein
MLWTLVRSRQNRRPPQNPARRSARGTLSIQQFNAENTRSIIRTTVYVLRGTV